MPKMIIPKHIIQAWDTMVNKLSATNRSSPPDKETDFFAMVEQARQEWKAAKSHFDQVSDPDLVDYAVYAMEAAEHKYTYLLKKARLEGYRLPAKIDALRERR